MSDGSFKPLTWLRAVLDESCTLDPYEALVMLALVRYADEQGRAWPGFAALTSVTRVSRTRLIKALDSLERRGCFRRSVQKRGQGFGTNTYELTYPPPTSALGALPDPSNGTAPSAPHALGSAPHALGVVRPAYSGSAPHAPYLPIELTSRTDQGTAGARSSAPHALPSKPKRAKATRSPTKGSRKPETSLPEAWQPTKAHAERALTGGIDLELEAEKFKGHALAKDRKYVNWDAAFTTWLCNAIDWRGPRRAPPPQRGVPSEAEAQSWGRNGEFVRTLENGGSE